MAKVTVVMPTYLRQEYLPQALDSLLAQEFKEFTALVCDNANSETTRRLVAGYGDDRLVYVPRPENLGLVRNTLEGFAAARTEYVTKLDDDDLFEPGYLKCCVEALDAHPEASFAFTDMKWIGPEGEPLPEVQHQQDEQHGYDRLVEGLYRPLVPMLVHGVAALNATVLRTDAVDFSAVPPGTETAFDLHILLEAARSRQGAWHVAERLVGYRVHPGTDSAQNYLRQLNGRMVALRCALEHAAPYERAVIESSLVTTAVTIARVELVRGNPRGSRAALRRVAHRSVDPALVRVGAMSLLPSRVSQPFMSKRDEQWRKRHGMGRPIHGSELSRPVAR